ncbi:MAG: glycosyltransferase family 2 protein [Gemmatimonadaceae bacterium]|nr:glycosyltransferase family 2 protein [Gemmatimonadaceae bacterium]
MKLSIVTTMYMSSAYIAEFHRRISAAARSITDDFEIVFVNDGSPDDSLKAAVAISGNDKAVRVVDLSRNFGHHRAMMAGLEHSRGERVFLIDVDLEEEPELLTTFETEMNSSRADVVYGVQTSRKGGLGERVGGDFFFGFFNMLSSTVVPRNVVVARLMTRQYVESLLLHREREIFMLGLWTITGFTQLGVPVVKTSKDSTTYTLRRKLSVTVNAITSFSNTPLRFIFYLGFAVSFVSAVAALYLVVRTLFFGQMLAGWASLIVSVWLLAGLTLFSLGIIGIYLSKIFSEVKQRPYTIVRAVYGSGRIER